MNEQEDWRVSLLYMNDKPSVQFSEEDDIRFMNEAFREAEKAFDLNEIPIGCVIVWQDRIIARAHNLTEKLRDFTAHAEMQAFTSASDFLGHKYLNECTLYVTLEPCAMCSGAAFWTQLGRIVFGAFDTKRGISTLSTSILHPKTSIKGGIMEKNCAEIMSRFFQKKRKS